MRRTHRFPFAAACLISAVLILFRTAFFVCADETEDAAGSALSVSDILLFAGEDGETVREKDGSEWFRYDYESRLVIVSTDETGKEEILCGKPADDLVLTEKEPQGKENPWEPGDHTVLLENGESSCEFKVRIVERKIAGIAPEKPVRLLKTEEAEIYDLSELPLTVSYEGCGYTESILLKDTEHDAESSQKEKTWDEGMHPVSFTYQGFEGAFDADVVTEPVFGWKPAEAQYWTAAEQDNTDGDGKVLVDPKKILRLTVMLYDGTEKTGTLEALEKEYAFSSEVRLSSGGEKIRLEPGKTAELVIRLFGKEETVKLTVSEKKPSECAHAHPEDLPEILPDCTSAGRSAGTRCRDCGKVLSGGKTVRRTGHSMEALRLLSAPDCTTSGELFMVCEVCGETERRILPAYGHAFGEYSVVREATEEKEGLEERVCSRCGHREERAIPVKETQPPETEPSEDASKSGESSETEESKETSKSEEPSETEPGKESSESEKSSEAESIEVTSESEAPSETEESGKAEESAGEASKAPEKSTEESTASETEKPTAASFEEEMKTEAEKEEESGSEAAQSAGENTGSRTDSPTQQTRTEPPKPTPAESEAVEKKGSERAPIEAEIRDSEGGGGNQVLPEANIPADIREASPLKPIEKPEPEEETDADVFRQIVFIAIGILSGASLLAWILFLLIRKVSRKHNQKKRPFE